MTGDRQPATLADAIPHALTLDDVARFLNCSPKTIVRLLVSGRLPIREYPRLGRVRRFRGDDLRAYLDGRAQPTGRTYFTRAQRSA
jgi:excisionase family DNA binding protein